MYTIYIESSILIGLLLLSGFFSATEMSLFSLSPAKIRQMVERGMHGARVVEKLKDEPQELLITILIGNTIVNIFASAFATSIALEAFRSNGIGIATGVMTFLILVFGEIVPKSIASSHNQKIALLCARPILLFKIILMPLTALFKVLVQRMSSKKSEAKISESEIRAAASLALEVGVVEKDEKEMIENVFELNDTFVREIMTPLNKVPHLSVHSTSAQTIDFFKKYGFSRIPVYQYKKKNIIGIIHVKDFLTIIDDKHFSLDTIAIKALYCQATDRADHLLHRFRTRQQHFAFVQDHKNRTVGIVTLEDVLEELVGEIEDESDSQSA